MDLKLKDVAELLNVSEKTVKRWMLEGRLPHYRLNQELRFSRSEIESWVLSRTLEEPTPPSFSTSYSTSDQLGINSFGLYRALHRGGVWTNVSGETKEEVIRCATEQIAKDLNLDADVLSNLLLDRERLMSTALSHGIAVPHTRDFLLSDAFDVVAVVYLQKPIEYGALDGELVHTLFFLFACDDRRHLHLLAKIAHLCRHTPFITMVQEHPDKETLLDFVKVWEANLREGKDDESTLSELHLDIPNMAQKSVLPASTSHNF